MGSVVAMVSIGEGAQENSKQYRIMGSRSTHIKTRPVAKERVGDVVNTSVRLSRQDAQAIGDALIKMLKLGGARIPVSITSLKDPCIQPRFWAAVKLMPVHSLDVSEGQALAHDVRGRRVAVLGAQLADRLSPRCNRSSVLTRLRMV